MATGQATREAITLKGSTAIVTEFFGYAVNSILYQRGIYPEESFTRAKKYGLPMLVCTEERIVKYLKDVLGQISDWLMTGNLQKLVLVVASLATKEVLERWVFNIETDKAVVGGSVSAREKSDKEIMVEIQAIVRQITASVTFLPLLDEPCTFDLLAYTSLESNVPSAWEESDARLIANSHEVKLRSFSTKVHQVDAIVAYRQEDD